MVPRIRDQKRPGRVPGSCRFDPYAKVQLWDATAFAWRDVQRSYADAAEASRSVPTGKRYRVVTVTEAGRTFGEPTIKEPPC